MSAADVFRLHREALEGIENEAYNQLSDSLSRATRITAATVLGDYDALQQLGEESRDVLRQLTKGDDHGEMDAKQPAR